MRASSSSKRDVVVSSTYIFIRYNDLVNISKALIDPCVSLVRDTGNAAIAERKHSYATSINNDPQMAHARGLENIVYYKAYQGEKRT